MTCTVVSFWSETEQCAVWERDCNQNNVTHVMIKKGIPLRLNQRFHSCVAAIQAFFFFFDICASRMTDKRELIILRS